MVSGGCEWVGGKKSPSEDLPGFLARYSLRGEVKRRMIILPALVM